MKVLLVTYGAIESPITWSGVPLRIREELIRLGIEVVCEDVARDKVAFLPKIFFNRVLTRYVKKWRGLAYEATALGIFLQSRWLRKVARLHADCDLILVCSYSFNAKGVRQPVILIHDWPRGYLQKVFGRRELTLEERRTDERQLKAMREAAKVVSLYPLGASYLREHLGDKVKFYGNPINIKTEGVSQIGGRHVGGLRILLVGGLTYQENVECVIRAVNRLGDDTVQIDVVGVSSAKTKLSHGAITFYGYLDRRNPEARDTYNKLFDSAKCFINVRSGWGGGSSIAEALYRGVPVIMGYYPELMELYGKADDRFGFNCCELDDMELAEKLRLMRDMPQERYMEMCRAAHELVKDDTYDRFVKQVIDVA